MAKKEEYNIHYGDSGEPNASLYETMANSKEEAILNFAKAFGVPLTDEEAKNIDIVEGTFFRHGIILGDVE